jgi:hypothetical protein
MAETEFGPAADAGEGETDPSVHREQQHVHELGELVLTWCGLFDCWRGVHSIIVLSIN